MSRCQRSALHFVAMPFRVVFVGLAVFFVTRGFVRSITERLILRQAAHANPDRFLLGFDFKRSFVRFQNFAHCRR